MGVSHVLPAFVTPGQRMMLATRIPPSYIQPLPPRNGKFDVEYPSAVDNPPLSDVNNTIVLSARPSASNLSRTMPTASSVSSIIAAYTGLSCTRRTLLSRSLPQGDALCGVIAAF